MLQVLLIGMVVFMFSKLASYKKENNEVDKIVKETHKYSGIYPTLYRTFQANMNLAIDYMKEEKFNRSQTALVTAVNNLNDIAHYTILTDIDLIDEIAEISDRLGITFERILIQKSLIKGENYRPKYI
jgi:3-phosphoglycerate kinase